MKYAGKDYPEAIEIGFYLPPGYKVGEKIRIKGRSARRAGSEEAADFLNRESGHTILDVQANKNNIGGNGGWVVIESMEGSSWRASSSTQPEAYCTLFLPVMSSSDDAHNPILYVIGNM